MVIEAQDIIKKYDDTLALDALTLNMNRGDFLGLLGANGAGKTTFMSIICGWTQGFVGELRLFKQIHKGKLNDSIKRKIGVVPQDIALFEKLNVMDNLMFYAQMQDMSKQEAEDKMIELLQIVHLENQMRKKVGNLSGGMKRRINLIASLLHNPELILLDEPTVGIDVESKEIILHYLKKLNREGVSILYTSHDLPEAEKVCNQIAFIDHGKIKVKGNKDELLREHHARNIEELYHKALGKKINEES